MSYLITVDDLFSSKAATSVGSGANSVGVNGSTGIGIPTTVNGSNGGTSAGWLDFTGNLWQIASPAGVTGAYNGQTNAPGGSGPPTSVLYRPSGENFAVTTGQADGYARAWQPACQSYPTMLVGRFNSTSGGSCYAAMQYTDGKIYVYKAVTGTRTNLVSGASWASGTPITTGAMVLEMILTQTDATHTQITVNQYNPSDLTTIVATYSYTDTEATLQGTAGAWGVGGYNPVGYTRVQLAKFSAGGTLTTGSLSADSPAAGRSIANLVGAVATGGTGPYSYQLHRSLSNGFTPTWSGGTLVQSPSSGSLGALQDTGLTPGTTYYYKLMAQDSAGSPATVTSGQVTITTYSAGTVILGFLGDSLTKGDHATSEAPAAGYVDTSYSAPAQMCYFANANADGNNYIAYNLGVSGSTTANWLSGQANYIAAAAIFAKAQVTDVMLMLGTNDARTGVTAVTYASNIAAICASLLTVGSIVRVHLNFPTYDRSGGGNEGLLFSYLAKLQAAANGTTIIMGDSSAHQTIFDSPVNLYYTSDYIHLIDPGYASLGYLWWKSFSGLTGLRRVGMNGGISG